MLEHGSMTFASWRYGWDVPRFGTGVGGISVH